MIRPVFATLLVIVLMACDAAPTPTPTQTPPSLSDYCDQHNGCPWLTPTPPPEPTPAPEATPTPAPQPTATPSPFYTEAPSGRTPTPRPTATPTSTPTVTPIPTPTPSGAILSEAECKIQVQAHWDAVVPTLVQEIARDFLADESSLGFQLSIGGGEWFVVYTEFRAHPRGVYRAARHGWDIPVPQRWGMVAIVDWAGARADDFSSFWQIESTAHYDPWTCRPLEEQEPWTLTDDATLRQNMWVSVYPTQDAYENEASRQERPEPIRLVLEPSQ